MGLLALMILPLYPIFSMMGFELSDQSLRKNNIHILHSVENIEEPKTYFTYCIAGLIKLAIFLGCILIIGAIGGLLFLLGIGIYRINPDESLLMLPYFFMAPAAILLIAFLLYFPFLQSSIGYVLNVDPELKAAHVLFNSFDTYKNGGKLHAFIYHLWGYGILGVILGLFSLISSLAMRSNFGLGLVLILLFILIFLAIAPFFSLSHKNMMTLLYQDIVNDKYTKTKKVAGVKFSGLKLKEVPAKDQNLLSIFEDEVEEEIEDPQVDKKKAKEDAKAEKERQKLEAKLQKEEEAKRKEEEKAKAKAEALEKARLEALEKAKEEAIEEIPAPAEEPEEATVEEAPIEEAPIEEAPVEEAPIEEAPIEEAPIEDAPIEESPIEEAPLEEAPTKKEEPLVEESKVEEAPLEEAKPSKEDEEKAKRLERLRLAREEKARKAKEAKEAKEKEAPKDEFEEFLDSIPEKEAKKPTVVKRKSGDK